MAASDLAAMKSRKPGAVAGQKRCEFRWCWAGNKTPLILAQAQVDDEWSRETTRNVVDEVRELAIPTSWEKTGALLDIPSVAPRSTPH